MGISCVTLNYNDAEETVKFIKSIYDYGSVHKIIVVDNCSTDNSLEILKKYEDERVIVISAPKNGGYGYGNNIGVNYVHDILKDDYAIISNPDVFFKEEIVLQMISLLKNYPDAAVVSALQKDIKGINTRRAWRIPSLNELMLSEIKCGKKRQFFDKCIYSDTYLNKENTIKVDCVLGAFFAINTNHFIEVGEYDENMFLFYEETVLGIKMKNAGYKTLLITDMTYDHNHSHSLNRSIKSEISKYRLLVESRLYLMKNYYDADSFHLFGAVLVREYWILKMRLKELLGI